MPPLYNDGTGKLLRSTTAGKLANTCGGDCDYCDANTEADDLQVSYSGFADQSCTGTSCSSALDGTHTLTKVSGCNWTKTGIDLCGNSAIINAFLQMSGSDLELWVVLLTVPPAGGVRFKKVWTSTSSVDCSTFSALSMTFVEDVSFECDGTSATCSVTSL